MQSIQTHEIIETNHDRIAAAREGLVGRRGSLVREHDATPQPALAVRAHEAKADVRGALIEHRVVHQLEHDVVFEVDAVAAVASAQMILGVALALAENELAEHGRHE